MNPCFKGLIQPLLMVNFEQISHIVLLFLILTFEQANGGWAKGKISQTYIENPDNYLRWSVLRK